MKKNNNCLLRLSLLAFIAIIGITSCESPDATGIKTHRLFTDHAVLQREKPLKIWGTADAGGTLEVHLGEQSQKASVDAEGKWSVELAAMDAGGPYELEISGGDSSIVLHDIMIGDVWVASGQSNMEWPLQAQVDNFEEEIANANFPEIRLFTVGRNVSYEPLEDLTQGSWQQTSPETIGSFSAVAYFFGREINQEIGVPIGLISSNWGGTKAEAWTSEEAVSSMSEFADSLKQIEQQLQNDPASTDVEKRKERDRILAEANMQAEQENYTPVQDTESWPVMQIPTFWGEADSSLIPFDGIVWFQKTIDIPERYAGKSMTLHLGQIDDADVSWFNNQKVGQTDIVSPSRIYEVPASAVKAGENTITIRVLDDGGNGGLVGPAKDMYMEVNGENTGISLDGPWKYKANNPLPKVDIFPVEPGVLFNAMIHPLLPYPIKGVIWYQGESNASRAEQYQTLFPLMIEDWRNQWKEGDFPFLFVQLANYITGGPGDESWAELREAQLMALDLDNTGMAVTTDIGDSTNIHPRNKQDVGRRLALSALKVAYGQENAWSGPLYESMRVEGDSAIITFKEVDEGLMVVPGEKLKGFTIAGEDQQFYPASAKIISNNEVSVKSIQVAKPKAVRYGWANNPKTNLYNEAFLPASPFRTDDWKKIQNNQNGI